VHLALASITMRVFDLWAKSRGIPLWKLLLDLTPEEVVATLDLSYVEDALSEEDALTILQANAATRSLREPILQRGYPGYDTSVGWMAYDDQKVRELTMRAIDRGFKAFKLKVGSADESRDLAPGRYAARSCRRFRDSDVRCQPALESARRAPHVP